MKKETEAQKLQSYQNIWTYDKRIYALLDFVLPTSVSISEFVYFAVIEIIVIILNVVLRLPSFSLTTTPGMLIFAVKFFVIPYALTGMLKYNKLDGKKPVAFFRDYITFFFDRNKQYEFFRDVTNIPEQPEYIIQWQCSYRCWMVRLSAKGRKQL